MPERHVTQMAVVLRTHWWTLLLRGIAALIFSIATFAVPGVTIAILVTIFGIYALIDGILAIVAAIRAVQGHQRWGFFLVEGVIGILVGLYAITVPVAAAAIFITLLAIWAIVTGVLEIIAALRLRRHIQGEWVLIVTGLVSIALGILLFAAPVTGAVFLVWVLAGYGLLFGVLLITLSLRVRRHASLPLSQERIG